MKSNFIFCIISLALISCGRNSETFEPRENTTTTSKKALSEKDMAIIIKESESVFEKLNESIFKNIKTITVNTSLPKSVDTHYI